MKIKNSEIKKTKLAGFISAELGIGMLVASVLALTGYIAGKEVHNDSAHEKFKSQHNHITTTVNSVLRHNSNALYEVDATYREDITDKSKGFGVFTKDMIDSDGSVYGPLGEVKLLSGESAAGNFEIAYYKNNISEEICLNAINWLASTQPHLITDGPDGSLIYDSETNVVNMTNAQDACITKNSDTPLFVQYDEY